jgi:hypothetical protein
MLLTKWTKGRFLQIKTRLAHKRSLSIALQQKLDATGRSKRGNRRRCRHAINTQKGIIDENNVATVLCGLQTSARNRSVTLTEMESLLTLWTEDCSKKRIPLSRTAVQKKK